MVSLTKISPMDTDAGESKLDTTARRIVLIVNLNQSTRDQVMGGLHILASFHNLVVLLIESKSRFDIDFKKK